MRLCGWSGLMRVNGDSLRRLVLPLGSGCLASDVDDLLRRVADEIDAGRPVGDLVANAAPRVPEPLPGSEQWPLSYDARAVYWLLGQLRRCDDDEDRARLENDPWRDLAAWDFLERHTAGPWGTAGVIRSVGENADAWLACGALPGTRLWWVRAGVLRGELRDGGRQVPASVRGRVLGTSWGEAGTVLVGGRAFTSRQVSHSAWPGTAATFGAGFPAVGNLPGAGRDSRARMVADQYGLPVLCTGGEHFDRRDGAYIRLPGGRWFQFPVRGWRRRRAIMTALDQDGNKVALYRMAMADSRFRPPQVEIAVHPDQRITDELLLVLAVSAPWLRTFFMCPSENGGG